MSRNSCWKSLFRECLSLRRILIVEGKLRGEVAHIFRPVGNQLRELPPVICKKRPGGFLESGQIASRGRHEPICCFLRGAYPITIAACSPGFVHQLSQGDGGAARLQIQPVPVPRQQSHLFCNNPEPWTPATARLGSLAFIRDSARFRSEVKVNLGAGGVIEHKHLALWTAPDHAYEFFGTPRSDLSETMKGGETHELNIPG